MNRPPVIDPASKAEAELQRLRNELDDLRQQNQRLRDAAIQMRAEILTLNRSLEPGREEELELRIAELENLVATIVNSRSWRLTAFYRAGGRRLKRWLGRVP